MLGSVIRVGIRGVLSRGKVINAWLGLGIGYKLASIRLDFAGQEITGPAKGFEFANLQAGADFALAGGVGIGSFVSCSVGQYSGVAIQPDPIGQAEDIPDKAFPDARPGRAHGFRALNDVRDAAGRTAGN